MPPNLGGDQNERVRADLAFGETPAGRRAVRDFLDRVVRFAVAQRLRQQCFAHHRERAATLSRPQGVPHKPRRRGRFLLRHGGRGCGQRQGPVRYRPGCGAAHGRTWVDPRPRLQLQRIVDRPSLTAFRRGVESAFNDGARLVPFLVPRPNVFSALRPGLVPASNLAASGLFAALKPAHRNRAP